MAKSYKELKLEHRDKVLMVKKGLFYDVYFADAYLISQYLGYKVSAFDYKLGFPSSVLNKVIKTLLDHSVNVIIFDNNGPKEYNAPVNKYREVIASPMARYRRHKALDESIILLRKKVIDDFTKYDKVKEFVEIL